MNSRSYHRNNKGGNDSARKSGNVSAKVRELIRAGRNDHGVLAKLKAEYGDNNKMIDDVFEGYKERLEYIKKKANKFKNLMYDRYNKYNPTLPQLLKKAEKYKKRYDLSSDEFDLFVNSVLNDERFEKQTMDLSNTDMAKALGYNLSVVADEKLQVKDNELDVLQDILRMHGETKVLHSQVSLQSLTYDGAKCLPLRNCEYKADKHNPYSFVHPLVAALFTQRIGYLDEHMLIANLSHIIKCKYEGKPVETKPEYELLWDIMVDPNDKVCDMSSPLQDLKNRVALQTRLWDSVLCLRNGKHFDDKLVEFLVAVDNCRNSIYDVPDLTYVKDEGAILRRLLSAFSLRPTVIATQPLYGVLSNNPHVNPSSITQVTTVPMISVRLPYSGASGMPTSLGGFADGTLSEVPLEDVITQPQWYVQNKMLVPKTQQIMYSKDVLIVYINRRYQQVNLTSVNQPYNFNNLPMTVSGFEKLNGFKLKLNRDTAPAAGAAAPAAGAAARAPARTEQYTLAAGSDKFFLTSAVCVTTMNASQAPAAGAFAGPHNAGGGAEMITGSKAYVFCHAKLSPSTMSAVGRAKGWLCYDPAEAVSGNTTTFKDVPIPTLGATPLGFEHDLQHKCTVLVFTKQP